MINLTTISLVCFMSRTVHSRLSSGRITQTTCFLGWFGNVLTVGAKGKGVTHLRCKPWLSRPGHTPREEAAMPFRLEEILGVRRSVVGMIHGVSRGWSPMARGGCVAACEKQREGWEPPWITGALRATRDAH